MTIAIAIEFIPIRMKDYGFTEYDEQFRHFVLRPSETRIIESYNQFYFLIEENPNISISSYTGDYDLAYPGIDEQTYEHQGFITITNNGSSISHVQFIHLIPKENNNN